MFIIVTVIICIAIVTGRFPQLVSDVTSKLRWLVGHAASKSYS